jgi:hypothetical protein
MQRLPHRLLAAAAIAVASILASCGGGGGGSGSADPGATVSAGAPAGGALAVSSGTITAFGSIFVNGREFATAGAQLVDDDTGLASTDLSGLEVGMEVDVVPASASTASQPMAAEIHLQPLARGAVDAIDTTASTLTLMGQTVQVAAATGFSDHRACVSAATSPCSAISGLSGLTATTGSGAAAVAGSYVTVHGYLYGGTAGSPDIVATLVVIGDTPTSAQGAAYKAEGAVDAVGSSSITISGLTIDLSAATCYAAAGSVPCSAAYSVGQVVSAWAPTAPALPASSFKAVTVRLHGRLAVQSAGAAVEIEGKVASVSTASASFAIRGLTVDASALTASSLPAVGDVVRVAGTLGSGGTTIQATAVTVLRTAPAASYGLQGDFSSVAAGSAANTYVLSLLGQSVAVDASTHLADRSKAASTSAFNISSFASYLAASSSKHLLVQAQADASGALSALSVVIVPAATVAGISGSVDATPAPVNSSGTGTPTTFSVHGLAVAADPTAFLPRPRPWGGGTATAVAAGDYVLVRGSYATGLLTVAAVTRPAQSATNIVIDFGTPGGHDRDCF